MYTEKWWKENKFVKGIGSLAEVANDVSDFYKRLTNYCMAMDMAEEMLLYLKEMNKVATDGEFKKALNNVMSAFRDADFAAMICTTQLAHDIGYNFVTDVIEELAVVSNKRCRRL